MAFPKRRRYAEDDDHAEAIFRYNEEKAEAEEQEKRMREKQEYDEYLEKQEQDRYDADYYNDYYDGTYDDLPVKPKPVEFHKGFKRIAE